MHDPQNSARQGDVVAIAQSWRESQHVRHVVRHIIAPYGPGIDDRPAVPTVEERVAERAARRKAKDGRREVRRREAGHERAAELAAKEVRKALRVGRNVARTVAYALGVKVEDSGAVVSAAKGVDGGDNDDGGVD